MHFQQKHTQNMGQNNNSPTENVHNTVSGILHQWIEREKKYMHFQLTETHTQNMGEDNNSPAENVHNTVSGILRQWIEREEIHALSTETHSKHGTKQQLTG